MPDYRIVCCPACNGEGRLTWGSGCMDRYGNEMLDDEPCDLCEGTGGEIIAVEPIQIQDLDGEAGVYLPPPDVGAEVTIVNNSSKPIKVFVGRSELKRPWACIACNQFNSPDQVKCWRCGRKR